MHGTRINMSACVDNGMANAGMSTASGAIKKDCRLREQGRVGSAHKKHLGKMQASARNCAFIVAALSMGGSTLQELTQSNNGAESAAAKFCSVVLHCSMCMCRDYACSNMLSWKPSPTAFGKSLHHAELCSLQSNAACKRLT